MKKTCLIMILFVSSLASAFDGLQEWSWGKSHCLDCGIYFKVKDEAQFDDRVLTFKESLEKEKATLLQLYSSDPQEYNLLAWMALGILGRESNFYESGRYKIKEAFPLVIRGAKIVKAELKGGNVSANSRGPTQIKKIPERIAWHYNIKPQDLHDPHNAAVATMGFLIEALEELKNRARNNSLEFITRETYVDYLPYIYFGKSRSLTERTATPEANLYVKEMKAHMRKFEVYEVYF